MGLSLSKDERKGYIFRKSRRACGFVKKTKLHWGSKKKSSTGRCGKKKGLSTGQNKDKNCPHEFSTFHIAMWKSGPILRLIQAGCSRGKDSAETGASSLRGAWKNRAQSYRLFTLEVMSLMISFSSRSVFSMVSIRSAECMTVVWSRPSNSLPISFRDRLVICRI